MLARIKTEFELIQFTKDTFEDFKKLLHDEKGYDVVLNRMGNKYYCITTNTMDTVFIHEGEYVVFKDLSWVKVISEKEFLDNYEVIVEGGVE